jgi:hypothetical protein
MKEEHEALIYNYTATYIEDKFDFEQVYLFAIEKQVVPTTTTTTTTATTVATATVTMASETTSESVAVPSAASASTNGEPSSKGSAAPAQTSVPHFTLIISAFFVWLVKH